MLRTTLMIIGGLTLASGACIGIYYGEQAIEDIGERRAEQTGGNEARKLALEVEKASLIAEDKIKELEAQVKKLELESNTERNALVGLVIQLQAAGPENYNVVGGCATFRMDGVTLTCTDRDSEVKLEYIRDASGKVIDLLLMPPIK